jgi:hypothetical protein
MKKSVVKKPAVKKVAVTKPTVKKSVVKKPVSKVRRYAEGGTVTPAEDPYQAQAQRILQMAVGRIPIDMKFDMNGDGEISSADALAYLKKAREADTKTTTPTVTVAPTPPQPTQFASTQSPKGTFSGQATPEAREALLKSQSKPTPTPVQTPTKTSQKVGLTRLSAAQSATAKKQAIASQRQIAEQRNAKTVANQAAKKAALEQQRATYNQFLKDQAKEAKYDQIKAKPPGMAKGGMVKKKVAVKKSAPKKK